MGLGVSRLPPAPGLCSCHTDKGQGAVFTAESGTFLLFPSYKNNKNGDH